MAFTLVIFLENCDIATFRKEKEDWYMAAFLRQIKIRVLTLTSRKSNEKIKIYGAADIEGAPKPARR